MNSRINCAVLLIAFSLSLLDATTASAQSSTEANEPTAAQSDRSADIIAQHKLLTLLRGLEADSRELYFDQTFILLYLHGDRTEWIGSHNKPARMLSAAVESRFVPKIKRLKARMDRIQGLNPEQMAHLGDALDSIEEAIEAGYAMAEQIREEDIDAATQLFFDRSLPAFQASWRGLYTLTSELELQFPKR